MNKKNVTINGFMAMSSNEKEKSSRSIKELLNRSKEKIMSRKKESSDLKKSTIGKKLISEILESKKISLEITSVQISEQAIKNLKEQSKQRKIPIEQIISNLIEENFNPRNQK